VRYTRRRAPDASKGITTVLTTCCRSNVPSIHIIQRQFEGCRLVPELLDRIVIGFDGAALGPVQIHNKCRGECDVEKYEIYIRSVIELARRYFKSVDYVVAPYRSCLTLNLKAALKRVTTDFVYICQEDLVIKTSFDVLAIMRIIAASTQIELVRVSLNANDFHIKFTRNFCGNMKPLTFLKEGAHTFTRCDQYADQNHITYVDFYNDAIFPHVKEGDFMEHQLICAHSSHPHLDSTMWFLGEQNGGDYVAHLDGRNAA